MNQCAAFAAPPKEAGFGGVATIFRWVKDCRDALRGSFPGANRSIGGFSWNSRPGRPAGISSGEIPASRDFFCCLFLLGAPTFHDV
jgi:hypothetical protein